MKKSTLLSLVTAGAIVVTSAGTYAVWDQKEVTTNTATVKIDKAVTMTATPLSFTKPTPDALVENVADLAQTSTVSVDVKDVPESVASKYELKYTHKVTKGDGAEIDVLITDSTNGVLVGGATDLHTVNVTVTPKEAIATTGGDYEIEVKAELVEIVNP